MSKKKRLKKRQQRRKHNRIRYELKGRIQNSLSGFLRLCLVGLLVLGQIAFCVLLPFLLHGFTVYFYIIMEALSFFVIFGLVNDNRSQSYKMAWLSIMLLLPISGHIMYALWGRTNRKKKLIDTVNRKISYGNHYLLDDARMEAEHDKRYPVAARMSKYMRNCDFPLFKNNDIRYYDMGEDAFDAIFDDLEKANSYILLDFFIVAEGGLWDKMHEILLRKLHQGVRVKFIYDDFGAALRTNKHFQKNLINEGFEVRVFSPIHKYTDKLYMNYRSHQKIVVVDGNIGYTGGFNIADEYANLVERFGTWKDAGIRVEGDAVWGLTVIFLQMWTVCDPNDFIDYNYYRPTKNFPVNEVYCHVISDGPYNNPKNPIESTYKQMITDADRYLYIMTPYLVIEDYMVDTLAEAVKRGVDVRIITPSIPDKKSVKLVTEFNYGILLKNGVRIYEYTPGFIHSKVIQNEFSSVVGTINMDYRSFYLHYENGVWIQNKEINTTIRKDFYHTFAISKEITYEQWKNRPIPIRVWQQILNLVSTMM